MSVIERVYKIIELVEGPTGGSGEESITVDSTLDGTSKNPVENRIVTQAIASESNERSASDRLLDDKISQVEDAKLDAYFESGTIANVGDLDPSDYNSMATAENCNQYFQIGTLKEWGFLGQSVKIKTFSLYRRSSSTPNGSAELWGRILRWDGSKWYISHQASQYVVFNSYTNNGQPIKMTMIRKAGTSFIPTDERVIVCFANSATANVSNMMQFGAKVMPASPAMIEGARTTPPTAVGYTPNLSVKLAMFAEYDEKLSIDEKLDEKQDKLTAGENITIDEDGTISSTGGSTSTVLVDKQAKAASGEAGNFISIRSHDGMYGLEVAENILDDNTLPICLRRSPNSPLMIFLVTKAMVDGKQTAPTNVITVYGIEAVGTNHGTAIGAKANSINYGAALGYDAHAKESGTAVGFSAGAGGNGVAIGYKSAAANYGVAVGNEAVAPNHGVAIGNTATASPHTIAIGDKSASDETYPIIIGTSNYQTSRIVVTRGGVMTIGNKEVAMKSDIPSSGGGKATVVQDGVYISVANEGDENSPEIHVGQTQEGANLHVGWTTPRGDYADWELLSATQTQEAINTALETSLGNINAILEAI